MATVVFTGCSTRCSLGESVRRSSNSSKSGECRRPVTITISSCGGGSGVTEGLSFVCTFGGEGACSFFGDLIRSSLLICRIAAAPLARGDAGGFEIVWSGRSTPLLLPAGVCGVSGGVGGTVVCAVATEPTPSELGAFLLLGDEGVCGGGGAGPFSFFTTPFFSTSAAAAAVAAVLLLLLLLLLPLTLVRLSAGSTGGNTGAGTDVGGGGDFLASLCTLLLLSLAAATADGVVVVELGVVVVVVELGTAEGGDCADFALLSSSTGTGVDSFESLDDFDKDVGVSGSL